jgi:hypothetical protein
MRLALSGEEIRGSAHANNVRAVLSCFLSGALSGARLVKLALVGVLVTAVVLVGIPDGEDPPFLRVGILCLAVLALGSLAGSAWLTSRYRRTAKKNGWL